MNKYYYIINFENFIKPRIYPVHFTNRVAAKRAIKANFPSKKKRVFFEIIRGDKLKQFEATRVFCLGRLPKATKYDYPAGVTSHEEKKNYRTILRRRLRRMGMLTLVRSKFGVEERIPWTRLIENRQEVARSPYTLAKAFRLERKPKEIYYIIINKHISQKKGALFIVETLQVNIRTQQIRKQTIKVRRKDVIIPYLLTELFKLYGNDKKLLDTCRREGLKIVAG